AVGGAGGRRRRPRVRDLPVGGPPVPGLRAARRPRDAPVLPLHRRLLPPALPRDLPRPAALPGHAGRGHRGPGRGRVPRHALAATAGPGGVLRRDPRQRAGAAAVGTAGGVAPRVVRAMTAPIAPPRVARLNRADRRVT